MVRDGESGVMMGMMASGERGHIFVSKQTSGFFSFGTEGFLCVFCYVCY